MAPITSAINNTTSNITTQNLTSNLTSNLTTNVTITPTIPTTTPEEFYGNATYSDGSKIAKGSKIVAKDETGKVVGSFIMTIDGVYGDEYKSSPRLLVYAKTNNDISFYIDDIKSSGRIMKFNSASIRKVDIIISSTAKPTPIPTPAPTPVPATIKPTVIPTESPDNATPKFVGVLLISIAICVVGAIVTYYILTKKMKRDDDEEITL